MGVKVTALWIGEVSPDFGSSLIQYFLRTNYSHNAIIFEGMIWHATVGHEDPEQNGFCVTPIRDVLKNCVVRYCKEVETNFGTADELRGYLHARKGTPYSLSQNVVAVYPWLSRLPLIGQLWFNGKMGLNCSEAVAEICQSAVHDFGNLDLVKPTDTFRVLRPNLCDHNHCSIE